jgi:hypothetical protein
MACDSGPPAGKGGSAPPDCATQAICTWGACECIGTLPGGGIGPTAGWSLAVGMNPSIVEDHTDGNRIFETVAHGDGDTTHFSGTLTKVPIIVNSVGISIGATEGAGGDSYSHLVSGSLGDLYASPPYGNSGGHGNAIGTINYNTGEWSVDFLSAPGEGAAIVISYGQVGNDMGSFVAPWSNLDALKNEGSGYATTDVPAPSYRGRWNENFGTCRQGSLQDAAYFDGASDWLVARGFGLQVPSDATIHQVAIAFKGAVDSGDDACTCKAMVYNWGIVQGNKLYPYCDHHVIENGPGFVQNPPIPSPYQHDHGETLNGYPPPDNWPGLLCDACGDDEVWGSWVWNLKSTVRAQVAAAPNGIAYNAGDTHISVVLAAPPQGETLAVGMSVGFREVQISTGGDINAQYTISALTDQQHFQVSGLSPSGTSYTGGGGEMGRSEALFWPPWLAGELTPAEVNSDGFGVAISGMASCQCPATLKVSGIRVMVWWTAPSQPSPITIVNCPTVALPYLFIPQGQGQSVNELDGASSISQHDVYCIDPRGELKALLAQSNLLGSTAKLRLGFPGMKLSDFVVLSTMQIVETGWTAEGRVTFKLQDLQRYMKETIWLNGGPGAWIAGQTTPSAPGGPATAANASPVSDQNPRWLQGNPLDILLVALQNELGIGQPSDDPANWIMYQPGNPSTLISPNEFIDVPGILALRDGAFSGDWFEFKLTRAETGKDWIESQILRPLGLYTIVKSTGVLTLKSMKFPPAPNPVNWDNRSIIGIPTLERLPVINVVTVRMNVDDSQTTTAARSYNAEITFQQSDSIAQYRQQLKQQVEANGLRIERGGMARAFILADRIFRRHAFGTPVYNVKVQLRNLAPELGDYLSLSHPLVLDLKAGTLGITSVLCEIIDRQPNYANGTLDYKLLDTRFVQPTTPWQVAPAGTPSWPDAGQQQKDTYMFISTGMPPQYSDGTPGHRIF